VSSTSRLQARTKPNLNALLNDVFSGANLVLVCALLAYESTAIFITSLPPAPGISFPISSVPDWASWFDIDVVFPALIVAAFLLFRPTGVWSAVLFASIVSMIPTYFVAASYVFLYNPITYSGPGAVLLLLILAAPTAIALLPITVATLSEQPIKVRPAAERLFRGGKFWIAIAIPVTLVSAQLALRLLDGIPSNPFAWTSDIGWTLQYGGSLLLHGVDPYVHALPPYGGGAPLVYGPISFALVAPFGVFEVGVAAHLSAVFFIVVAGFGVWKTLNILNPRLSLPGTVLFILLPSTDIVIQSGTTLHILAAAVVVWSIYFYIDGRNTTAGLMCAVGTLIVIVPGALILPFLASAKTNKIRLTLLVGFAPLLILTLIGGFLVLKENMVSMLVSGLVQTVSNLSQFTFVSSLPAEVRTLFVWSMLVFVIGFSFYLSYNAHGDVNRFLLSCLWLLMMLPFALGYFLVFFFVWGSIPLVFLLCGEPRKLLAQSLNSELSPKDVLERRRTPPV
jgi:hypothetical protein